MGNARKKSLAESIETRHQATVALLLCVFLGYFGIHRFYLRRYGSGVLYLVTVGVFLFGWIADIFTLVRCRLALVQTAAPAAQLPVAGYCFDEEPRIHGELDEGSDEDATRRRELQEANREFLKGAGVNIDMFTPNKVVTDAMVIIGGLCAPMSKFDHGLRHEEPIITFASPTKTGKVPKNVVEASLFHEVVRMVPSGIEGFPVPEYGDSIRISISYLASGEINKADIHGSHEGHMVSVGVRNVGGAPSIASAGVTDTASFGTWQSLCVKPNATSDELFDALEKEVGRIYK